MTRFVALLVLVAAGSCGGPSPTLPPLAPMPPGSSWDGAWSTTFGALELVPTDSPEAPFFSRYAFERDEAPIRGLLACAPPADNHLFCVADDALMERAVLVMQPDGRSFVGNWWFDNERWLRWEGTRPL